MDCSIKLITAPLTEPVTRAELKLHTRISYTDEDALVDSWISTARRLAEDFTGRAYIAQQWEATWDRLPILPILLPRAPLMSIVSVKYYGTDDTEYSLYGNDTDQSTTTPAPVGTSTTTTTAEPNVITDSGYFIIDLKKEPGRLCFAYAKSWPAATVRPYNAFEVRYWAGYGPTASTVPEAVKDAIKIYCTWRNENRAAEIDEVPRSFYSLLWPERLYV